MRREIADSDADSDIDSPRQPSISPIPENVSAAAPLASLEHDPFANLEFDQFLSPTQRLSSYVSGQEQSQLRSTSSTDRFLREAAQPDHQLSESALSSYGHDGSFDQELSRVPRMKNKRTLSDIEGGRSRVGQDEASQKSVKRAKTYGSSKTQGTDVSSLFLSSAGRHDLATEKPAVQALPQNEMDTPELPVQPLLNVDDVDPIQTVQKAVGTGSIGPNLVRGTTTFLQGNIRNNSMTTSSVGAYQGINLDFRGFGIGLDTHTNPFGSLSQVSLDGDVDQSQTEKFTSLFYHEDQSCGFRPVKDGSDALNTVDHIDNHHRTVPPEKDHSAQQSESDRPKQKKRGRKPKGVPTSADISKSHMNMLQRPQSEDPLELLPEQYMPRPSRARAGTMDSDKSHMSHVTLPNDVSELKTKRSNHTDATEDKNVKQPSSELNVSDPAVIGIPKEMYIPRPSKSRSKRITEEEGKDELQEQPLSQKNATAQVHSSNKDLDVAQSSSTKNKPTKKSKVKRAKTSAAALLKSAEMYDEDDKDCIIVDEIPAKVKMAPLPEITSVKRKSEDEELVNKVERESSVAPSGPGSPDRHDPVKEVRISVDVPKLPKTDNPEATTQTGPKKRGRKPKKKLEVHTEPDEEEEEESHEVTILAQAPEVDDLATVSVTGIRAILSDKDPNMVSPSKSFTDINTDHNSSHTLPLKQPETDPSSPPKPVHSPLKPASAASSKTSTPTSTINGSGVLWTKPRVGLSRRMTIPSLLRKLNRSKEPPKIVERKEKLSKRQQDEEDRRRLEAEDAGEEYVDRWEARGKDGMLLEWDE